MRSRALLGLALLLSAAIWTAWSAWRQAVSEPPDPETAAAKEYYDRERFASVKPLLADSGAIGYREDDPPRSPMWPAIRFSQYVLAPVVLREGAEMPRVLVNGRPEVVVFPEAGGRPLPLLHDAGNGVRLFGAEEP